MSRHDRRRAQATGVVKQLRRVPVMHMAPEVAEALNDSRPLVRLVRATTIATMLSLSVYIIVAAALHIP